MDAGFVADSSPFVVRKQDERHCTTDKYKDHTQRSLCVVFFVLPGQSLSPESFCRASVSFDSTGVCRVERSGRAWIAFVKVSRVTF
jgi:hypothetical protein